MNIERPLMPGFLKRAEQKLLLNNPGIWSTRIQLVLYYGILFILTLAALCFLEPKDVRANSTTEYWIGFVSIISVIGLIVWLIYLLRFNVFKKYGNIKPMHGLVSFILYFIATGIIILFAFVHPVVESIRANIAYGDEEIVRDVNDINFKLGQLEYSLYKTAWRYDTIVLKKSENEISEDALRYSDYNDLDTAKEKPLFFRLDSAGFYRTMSMTDSLIKMNDTMYLMYNTPPFDFVSGYSADDNTKTKVLTAFELFHKIHRHPPAPAAREKISKELNVLLHKYRYSEKLDWGAADVERPGPFARIYDKYQLEPVNSSISNVVVKKYRWEGRWLTEGVRIFYYLTLGITLLIFIFRHSTVRAFFLSLLTGVLLVIFSALLFSFSHFDEIAVYAMFVIYVFLFFIFSLAAWANKKRFAITGIGINLFVFIITILPIVIVGWCRAIARNRHYKQVDTPFDPKGIWDHYFLYAEIGGSLLLLVLLATYIHKVYRRWYSLPEN
ncbi:hypothetical protein A3860_26375 [Niastella vici]|uniref:Uncharacterized protein n=1 Tax=Niastella vici TaxID=1703345 RepID=A0A1V9FWV0_9BACT|nr:hypothetical protein [Niastella vici]OQP62841.1 hypothetical protein A3860_26375 [Niastella vici]